MLDEHVMDGGMSDGMMAACVIGGTLYALVLLVTVIVQAVLLARILREVRRLRGEEPPQVQPRTKGGT